jgi:hypothetical protein
VNIFFPFQEIRAQIKSCQIKSLPKSNHCQIKPLPDQTIECEATAIANSAARRRNGVLSGAASRASLGK